MAENGLGWGTWLERSIEQLSPTWAVKRAASRMALGVLSRKGDNSNSTRRYEAGRPNQATAGWFPSINSSASTDVRDALVWVRSRARDLIENNTYAKKAVDVIVNNTIGTGIRPSIPRNMIAKPIEKKVMALYKRWAETKDCDYNGQLNFYGLMSLAYRAKVEGGDAFVRIMRSPKSVVPIKLQVLEADFLDHTRDGIMYGNGNYNVLGVEFDGKTHQRAAYWMWLKHPSDYFPIGDNLMSVRIPAEEVVHLYDILRPGQVRGVPEGVSAFIRLKNLDDYEDAQLVRQKIAACFSVFIKKDNPDFADQYSEQRLDDNGNKADLPPLSERVSPGIMEYLAPGESIEFANPPGTTGYEPYVRNNIRAIAAGYGVTYESISNDLSGVNFSSGRMGWLEMHRDITRRQVLHVVPMFCQEIFDHFMMAIGLRGVALGERILADWTPPRREMIDPVKEAHGMMMMVASGLASKSDMVRQMGDDPEKVYAEILEERKQADADGIMFDSDYKWFATRNNFGVEAYLASNVKAASGSPSRAAS